MSTEKFTLSQGNLGSLRITFYYVDKVTMKELIAACEKYFPNIPFAQLNIFPGIVSCTVTTGKTLEI